MYIYSVYDAEFMAYGKVLETFDTTELVAAMGKLPLPDKGVSYEPSLGCLEACDVYSDFELRAFGGMPVQIGLCAGHNTKLNCLEYHKSSELNIGCEDFVLLLAREGDIEDGKVDTGMVMAFKVPSGVAVEIYATSLHYAPCEAVAGQGFRVAIVLPRGTNTDKPEFEPVSDEDRWMTARNKWLLAHPQSEEAKNGAYVGITGPNIDISFFI